MFIELVDSLRCLAPHEETWLVAAVVRFEGRYIAEGALGCPICHAQYPIRDGVAIFAPEQTRSTVAQEAVTAADDAQLQRAAALLDLRDAGGVVILGGAWHAIAAPLALAFDVQCLVLNAPASAALGEGVSGMVVGDALPLAAGVARAAMLDAATATPSRLKSAVRALRPGGRLIAPSLVPLPHDARELARDQLQWVAEAEAAQSRPVQLRRR